ncbi:MAG: lipoate--protein ligase [Lachnospiraceae bacterium]|nr:lipoate--protein ligase [Lachnospiraceae bacterium]
MIRKISVWISRSTDPYENLATEEFLTFQAEPEECILFLWQNAHTVVIGRNQNCWQECRVAVLEEAGGHLARRLSGGGAVYHDLGNLNYTFCMKKKDADAARQMQVILRAVGSFGLDARMTGRNDAVAVCQSTERKFSGNAFFDSRGCYYHHGTLLLSADTQAMSRYLNPSRAKLASGGVASVRSRVVNLSELCSKITIDTMKTAIIRAASEVYQAAAEPLDDRRFDWQEMDRLRDRFASWDWNYGQKIPFTNRLGQRFEWGELELALKVNRGVIEEALLSSDAMEYLWFSDIGSQFAGCRYDAENISSVLGDILKKRKVPESIQMEVMQMLLEQM